MPAVLYIQTLLANFCPLGSGLAACVVHIEASAGKAVTAGHLLVHSDLQQLAGLALASCCLVAEC